MPIDPRDAAIVADLVDRGRLRPEQAEVWRRVQEGETVKAIRPTIAGPGGRPWHPATLYRWNERVGEYIDAVKNGRRVFGYSIANGRRVRHVGDPTPQGQTTRSKFPPCERLKVTGIKLRW